MTSDGVPEAWSALLSMEQLCAYLGGIAEGTVRKICPVAPLDLGANVLRYRKADVDRWIDTLPLRTLRLLREGGHDGLPAANDRPSAADKARARARKR